MDLTPAAGQVVRARIGGHECGQGRTQADGGRVVYVVDVAADAALAGCGTPGRMVTFEFAGRAISGSVEWNSDQAHELPLMVPQLR